VGGRFLLTACLPEGGSYYCEGILETVNCDLCASNDTDLVFEERDYLHHIDGTFYLVRCRRCGLMYLNPRPTAEEIVRYYPRDYRPHQPINKDASLLMRLENWYGMYKLCRAVTTHANVKSGRILDIGCSTGSFLDAMRGRGWKTYGVDIGTEAARYAREHLGLDVFVGTLHEACYPDEFFDVVTLFNVFEHLHQPQATLVEVARVIKPGGLLVISVPNPACIEARIFGRYWAGLDPPRHLYIHSRFTIEKALALTGFEMERMMSFTGRHHVLALSLGTWLNQVRLNDKVRDWLKRAVSSFPARLLTFPYYVIASRLNQNSDMTVFARRRGENDESSSRNPA